MFEVAQPSPSTPIDGLPTVHLSDTPEELAVFLKLVYFPGEDPYFRSFEVAAPMQWVSTALRLGRKYQVTYIADEAVGRLKRVCPSSIGELKERYKTIEDYEGGGMAIAIVNLARAFDLPELLPVALYYCCQLSNNILVHGVTHRNGTKDQLSPEDLVRCLEGRKTFLCSNILLTNEIAGRTIGCGDCFRRTPLDQDPHLSYDILFSDLGPFDHDTIDQEEYCHLCLSSLEVRVRDIQVTTFRDLPIIFGL